MPSPGISNPVDFSNPVDTSKTKGKTALVTGGASGLGAGVTRALAEAGAHVTIVDLNVEAGEQYASDLTQEGLSVQFARADVTDWQSQVDAFKKCIRHSPTNTVDIVIAAAGINGTSIFQDEPFLNEGQTEDPAPPKLNVLDVNLTGAYYTACLAVHYFRQTAKSEEEFLKAQKLLILVASNIAYFPVPLFSNYSASKAGVRALWISLRSHPHLTGMRANLLAPHIVRTPMTKDFQPLLDERGIKMVELSEVVDALMRMVCDDSIQGRAVAVNPGNAFDLCDEVETFQGAREFYQRHATETKDVFDWVGGLMEAGVQRGGLKQ